MERSPLKLVSVSLALAGVLAVAGCGTQSLASTGTNAAAASSAPASQTASDPNLMTSQQQVKSININAAKGQQEVNTQINQNLHNLDKTLNELDKSMGSL